MVQERMARLGWGIGRGIQAKSGELGVYKGKDQTD